MWAAVLLLSLVAKIASPTPRHIVFIVADDLGWNDVGFHNPDMITPNINKLAAEGVVLNDTYVQPLCSPSRHAFMTGYYPFKAGLQHLVIRTGQPVCSPLNMTFFPQKLKKLGYATHAVGKWHLGFCSWNCTPTYRGFDSYLGFYNYGEEYFTHTFEGYLDFHNNKQPETRYNGNYSTDVFEERAIEIIQNHNKSTPLFLYLPFQAVHEPIEVPKKWEDMYPNIKTKGRRQFCGMVTAMDNAIGNIVESLKKSGLYNDTLIIFTADNGGWPMYHGNNWPLRGAKFTIWEGGTRAAAFIHGSGLKKTGYTYTGMMHAVDWHPTIIAAAGGSPSDEIDGVNQWESISTGSASARSEFIYNLDDSFLPEEGHAAIRMGDYKLVVGYAGLYNGWYKPEQVTEHYTEEELYWKPSQSMWKDYITDAKEVRLYNLKDDPTEHVDLSRSLPDVVDKLKTRMKYYHSQMVPPNYPPESPASNPTHFNDTWSSGWC